MKTQVANLFEPKMLCHRNDPDTSYEAAEKMIKSGALSRQEKEVWEAIVFITYEAIYRGLNVGVDNFTAKELSVLTGLDYIKIQRRLSGLCHKGKIGRIQIGTKPDGKPIYKKRNGGCVWRIVR